MEASAALPLIQHQHQLSQPHLVSEEAEQDGRAGITLIQPLRTRLHIIAQMPHDLGRLADILFAKSSAHR